MKKQKLNLSNLKVNSFITDLSEANSETVKGGGTNGGISVCCKVYISIEHPIVSACICL